MLLARKVGPSPLAYNDTRLIKYRVDWLHSHPLLVLEPHALSARNLPSIDGCPSIAAAIG
jgi:hypothetical protein